jgi:hypothetical protein
MAFSHSHVGAIARNRCTLSRRLGCGCVTSFFDGINKTPAVARCGGSDRSTVSLSIPLHSNAEIFFTFGAGQHGQSIPLKI